MIMHDSLIRRIFFTKDHKVKLKYYNRITKFFNIYKEKYKNLINYLLNRYDDSDSIRETLFRIEHNVDKHPYCKTCGKRLKLTINRKRNTIFPYYCSIKCEMQDPEVMQKHNDTCIKKYGTVNNSEKTKNTFIKKYGNTSSFNSPSIVKKIEKTNIEKYGYAIPAKSDIIKDKFKQTCLKKYGVKSTFLLDKCKNRANSEESRIKQYNTKKQNNSFSTSKLENDAFCFLTTKYKYVIRQYSSKQYPYNCDFYIPCIDCYIEINGSWTHGPHPFDQNNDEDIKLLDKWKSKNTKFYNAAITTWTIRDVKKRKIAKENNLNFFEFWNLDDLVEWQKSNNLPIHYSGPLELTIDDDIIKREYEYYKLNKGNLNKQYNSSYIIKYFQQNILYSKEKELWENEKIKNKLIENRCKYLDKSIEELTSNDILSGFKRSGIYWGYSSFNPLWFKWFIEKFNIKSCYDPCGGWGHRLLGALDLDLYIYNDLSRSTTTNVRKIINRLNIKNTLTYCRNAVNFIPAHDYDAVFTCPPYFNIEHYPCGDFKNISQYYKLIDGIFDAFKFKETCKYLGLIIREDLLEDKYKKLAVDKILLSKAGTNHLVKQHKKYAEYLFIFIK